jgi:hypothetical protein
VNYKKVYSIHIYVKLRCYNYSDKFLQHTFNIDEFFDPSTLIELRNKSLFSLKENLSIFYGRGYTVCYLNKVSAKNIKFIRLKTLFDTQLFIHAKGDEFLIELSVYPTEVNDMYLFDLLSIARDGNILVLKQLSD